MSMQMATLEIAPGEAEEKLAEYEQLLASERTATDRAIAMAYRAVRRGLPVIRLPETIAAGGFDASGLPKMAVTRATDAECFVRWAGYDGELNLVYSGRDDWNANRGALVGRTSVRVPVADPPAHRTGSWRAAVTLVPLIPPRHRPKLRRLGGFHLLWEVEEWRRIAPRDPALIRHVGGELWTVAAVWDLTDLERHVLTARAGG
jgi:hypothetical protein